MSSLSIDDPDFLRFLNERFEEYLEASGQTETFESWFARLPLNSEMMRLVFLLYQLDQQGKRDNEALLVNLVVSKRSRKIPVKRPITDEEIDAFSQFMASGGLHDLSQENDQ